MQGRVGALEVGPGSSEEVSRTFAHISLSETQTRGREVGKCSLAACPGGQGKCVW